MPGTESFDAFYARTVWTVTSQMHAIAGADTAADHAIREAYARAYQQWYEIADNPDTESWVLAVAKEAYERRRPEAASRPAQQAQPGATGHDSLSWPGLYRPRSPAETPADPAATISPPMVGMGALPTFGAPAAPAVNAAAAPAVNMAGAPAVNMAGAPAGGVGLVPGPPNGVTAALPEADRAAPYHRPRPPGPPRRNGWPGSRRSLIALTAATAVIVAGGAIFLTTRPHPARQPAQHHTAANHQGPVMLPAGKTGNLSAIPWSLVGQGWTLAEVSDAPAGTGQSGTVTTYLVDPEGGRYRIQASSPGVTPQLLAWSGDGLNALYALPSSSAGGVATYELLSLQTGDVTSLQLPAGVTAIGFTRPDGQAILAVKTNPDAFKLQRYYLQGGVQPGAAAIASLPRKPGSPDWLPGCETECGALSSPDGLTDVWGVSGDEMQVVGNAGGAATKLTVPGSTSCVPLAWQDTTTVLASCSVVGQPSASQLWLVPANGGAPTQVTNPSGSPTGSGVVTGAWQVAGGATYVTQTNAQQCAGAASGPGGQALDTVSGGSLQPVGLKGTTNNHTSVISVSGGKLLVLAQTSCPGTSSLLEFDPPTGGTTTLLAGQANQVGVIAAVPYGGLSPSATNGQ